MVHVRQTHKDKDKDEDEAEELVAVVITDVDDEDVVVLDVVADEREDEDDVEIALLDELDCEMLELELLEKELEALGDPEGVAEADTEELEVARTYNSARRGYPWSCAAAESTKRDQRGERRVISPDVAPPIGISLEEGEGTKRKG